MEYIKGKSLEQLIGKLNEEIVWYFSKDLLKGLNAIHCRGILHNDIKPENIIFDQNSKQIRFIDFGLACFTGPYCGGGTEGYIAPEIGPDFKEPIIRDERADVYALGISLAECILNDNVTEKKIKKQVKNKKLKSLLLCMVEKNYKKRPYANQLLKKFFY
jgi:casein kinase II subunit alpha